MPQESSQGRPPSRVHEGSPSALRAPSGWEKKATWPSPPSGRCALGGRQSALLASAVDHTLRDPLDRLLGIPVLKRGNRHRVAKKLARICPRPGLHDQEPFCPAASLPPSPPGPGLRGLRSATVEAPNGRGPHRGVPSRGQMQEPKAVSPTAFRRIRVCQVERETGSPADSQKNGDPHCASPTAPPAVCPPLPGTPRPGGASAPGHSDRSRRYGFSTSASARRGAELLQGPLGGGGLQEGGPAAGEGFSIIHLLIHSMQST